MKILKPLSTLLLLTILNGCTFTSSYLNREEDKKEAQKITDQFFDDLKSKNYDAAYALFSKDFYSVTTKEKLKNMFDVTDEKLGNLVTTDISKWQTKIIVGTNHSSEYEFLYSNHYKKYSGDVDLRLSKNPDGKIRIDGFHINSDGFMAK